ncbi:YadA-like family protein [Stenotrophomonas maltophilia]|nr:YadA-like family protein [Stenotrophomonas maltophilia]ELN2592110.1 YadA-like family protein [Stenotrophomonas maltophilia]MBH1400018.1 YadA-like family protein [Stenotrophomonas maltophilia]
MKKIAILLALGLAAGAVDAQVVDPYGNIQIGPNTSISPPSNPDFPNTVKTGQIVIGDGASTDGQDAMAEGTDASAEGLEAIAKGPRAKARAMWAQAIGTEAEANDINTTASGRRAKANDAGDTATGALSETCGGRATATGIQAKACARQATVTGAGAEGTGVDSTVNGANAKATEERATTMGAYSEVNGVNGTVVGAGGKVNADRATCVGASCQANHVNSVGVGYGTKTTQENEVAVGYRRVTQVSSGRDDTDAANMSQVRATAEHLGGGAGFSSLGTFIPPAYHFRSGVTHGNVGSALDDLDSRVYDLEQNPPGGGTQGPAGQNGASAYDIARSNGFVGTEREWLDSLQGRDGVDGQNGIDGRDGVGGGSSVAAGENIEVQDNQDGTQTVSLSKDVDLTEQGSLTVGGTTVSNDGVVIQGGPSMTRQGVDAGNQRVTSVAPGRIERGSTDAVNGGQIYELNEQWNDRWTQIDRRFEKTDKRLNGLGAQMGAMTMMAATPGEGGVTVGLGHSGGETALAVGWSRRFNDRASIAVGASFGGGNKAVVGVGMRIGGR